MEVTFKGICTHLINQVTDVPHSVMLPDGKGIFVKRENGDIVGIPDHAPSVTITGALHQGGPLTLPLRRGRVSFKDIDEELSYPDPSMLDLPHLQEFVACEIDPMILRGDQPPSVAVIVSFHRGGTVVARGDKENSHFVTFSSSKQKRTWIMEIEDETGTRPIALAPDAVVTISNEDTAPVLPADNNDYLLHFQLTNMQKQFIPPADFRVSAGTEFSTTLTNCSNSIYP